MSPPTSENKEKTAQKAGFFFVQPAGFRLFRSEIALVFYFVLITKFTRSLPIFVYPE